MRFCSVIVVPKLCHMFKTSITYLYVMILPCILVTRQSNYRYQPKIKKQSHGLSVILHSTKINYFAHIYYNISSLDH
jgi:hypothetical protein